MNIYRQESGKTYFLADEEVTESENGYIVHAGICHTTNKQYDIFGKLHISKTVKYFVEDK